MRNSLGDEPRHLCSPARIDPIARVADLALDSPGERRYQRLEEDAEARARPVDREVTAIEQRQRQGAARGEADGTEDPERIVWTEVAGSVERPG